MNSTIDVIDGELKSTNQIKIHNIITIKKKLQGKRVEEIHENNHSDDAIGSTDLSAEETIFFENNGEGKIIDEFESIVVNSETIDSSYEPHNIQNEDIQENVTNLAKNTSPKQQCENNLFSLHAKTSSIDFNKLDSEVLKDVNLHFGAIESLLNLSHDHLYTN